MITTAQHTQIKENWGGFVRTEGVEMANSILADLNEQIENLGVQLNTVRDAHLKSLNAHWATRSGVEVVEFLAEMDQINAHYQEQGQTIIDSMDYLQECWEFIASQISY